MESGSRWSVKPPGLDEAVGLSLFSKNSRAWVLWALKLGLSLAFCTITLRSIPFREIQHSLGSIELHTAGVSLAVFVFGTWFFETWRLQAASRLLQEPRVGFRKWARYHLESRALFYILPAGLGAEGYLWWKLRRDAWSHEGCGYIVLFIRLLGSAVWAITLAWSFQEGALRNAGGVLLPRILVHPVTWLLFAAVPLTIALILRLWFRKRLRFSDTPTRAWLDSGLSALGTAVCCITAFSLAATSTGVDLPFRQGAGFIALTFFGMLLPISIAGLGLQEAIFIGLGQGMGLPLANLLALSVIIHFQRIALALTGLGLFLWQQLLPASDAPG